MAISAKSLPVINMMLSTIGQRLEVVGFQQTAQLAALTPVWPFKLAAEPIAHQYPLPKVALATGSQFLVVLTQIGISPE